MGGGLNLACLQRVKGIPGRVHDHLNTIASDLPLSRGFTFYMQRARQKYDQ